jgi:ribosomal protein S18 acetylase RimI-like enzyme
MVYQRGTRLSRQHFPTRKDQQRQNHREKKKLVAQGRSHGVLVYADGEPVGWCQYGHRDEIPLAEARTSRRWLRNIADSPADWRITCFVVDKRYRGRGVAATALRAALDAIEPKGGGDRRGLSVHRGDALMGACRIHLDVRARGVHARGAFRQEPHRHATNALTGGVALDRSVWPADAMRPSLTTTTHPASSSRL